jgi:hypothetical protein
VEDCIAGKEGRRKIPKFHEQNNKRRNQSSAPVNIPDWCEMIWQERKNIGNNSKKRHGVISIMIIVATMKVEILRGI